MAEAATATKNDDVQKVQLTPGNPVAQIAEAQEKLSSGERRAPNSNEVRDSFLAAAATSEAEGTSREDVIQAMKDAVEQVEAGNLLGPMNVVEVASGGGVIGHYDRNPVDSVVDTGRTSADGDSMIAQTAEVATPGNDGSDLLKGEGASDSEDDGDDEGDDGYASQSVEDLKEELRSRDLPVSGTKDELVARLEEDDASA